MTNISVNYEKLWQFENELDPQDLVSSSFPVTVMGYGEISTVLDIDTGDGQNLAYKRMPLFHNIEETSQYHALYNQYIAQLENIGITPVPGQIVQVDNQTTNHPVIYIIQQKLDPGSIGHKVIHSLPEAEIHRLVLAVLSELDKVFTFNQTNSEKIALGIDGQISNWAISNLVPDSSTLPKELYLVYFDTSTPLLTKDGQEQLNSELFLRSAPSFLVWILRLLFLEDVLTRYYDFRKVTIDLIANFYKEQRPELVPGLVETANQFFAPRITAGELEPLTVKEVKAYYQEDAWIWRLYLAFRRVDRTLHKLIRKPYPYILPGKIKR